MDDEYGLEPEAPQAAPPAEVPDWVKKQVSDANKEAEGLRKRLRERESEILTSKYEKVIDLLPEEVTSWDAKVTFLEKAQAKFGSTQQETSPTEPPEPVAEAQEAEPTEDELKLAAVAKGPSGNASSSTGMSADDLLQIAMTDPERYRKLRDAGHTLPKLSGSER